MLILIFIIILVIGIVIAASSYSNLLKVYNKYSDNPSSVDTNSLNFISACIRHYQLDTKIAVIDGELSDAYSTKRDIIFLSKDVANGTSVADISVATHELGHALQKKDKSSILAVDYLFGLLNRFANFMLPVALLCCVAFLFFEELAEFVPLIFYISVGLWFLTILFKIITIPLELDASKRAYKVLADNKLVSEQELKQTREILNAAALTYIGSLFSGAYKILISLKRSFRR